MPPAGAVAPRAPLPLARGLRRRSARGPSARASPDGADGPLGDLQELLPGAFQAVFNGIDRPPEAPPAPASAEDLARAAAEAVSRVAPEEALPSPFVWWALAAAVLWVLVVAGASSLLSPRREEEGWSDAGRRASRGVGTPDLVSASAWGGGGNSSGRQVSRPDPALAAGPRDVEALVATESRRRVAEARALARRRLEDRMAALVGSLGSVAVLPGDEEQRTEIDALVRELEALTPIWRPMGGGSRYDWARSSELRGVATGPGPRPELDGVWRLVYASDGTYVTRSPPAQALRALSALPLGFGVRDIRQKLRVDAREGVVRAANIAVIGLGPGGEWKVAVRGTWAPQGDGIVADVAFDELSVRPVSILGRAVDGREEARERAGGGGGLAWGGGELGGGMSLSLAELRVPLPSDSQSAAQWQTTFLGDRYRVGRGRSANLFVFERLRDLDPALDATVFS